MLLLLAGYGFSGEPAELGWESVGIARAWAELMKRIGYMCYVAEGGDVGATVRDFMGREAPEGLVGIHLNLLAGALAFGDNYRRNLSRTVRRQRRSAIFRQDGFEYFLEIRPGHRRSATSCWIRPSGSLPGCSTMTRTAAGKIFRAFVDGKPVGNLTRESIVESITLYWVTGTGALAARRDWEYGQFVAAARAGGMAPPAI